MRVMLTADEAKGCGIGEGAACCAYLLAGGDGFECGQGDILVSPVIEARVRSGQFTARRLPTLPFPACQQEGRP